MPADQVVRASVRLIAGILTRHAPFLRSVVLISGAQRSTVDFLGTLTAMVGRYLLRP